MIVTDPGLKVLLPVAVTVLAVLVMVAGAEGELVQANGNKAKRPQAK